MVVKRERRRRRRESLHSCEIGAYLYGNDEVVEHLFINIRTHIFLRLSA